MSPSATRAACTLALLSWSPGDTICNASLGWLLAVVCFLTHLHGMAVLSGSRNVWETLHNAGLCIPDRTDIAFSFAALQQLEYNLAGFQ